MKNIEDLIIYKQYIELIFYTENIVIKYPKYEKFSLVTNIKNTTYEGIKLIIEAEKERDKVKRLSKLNKLDSILKLLKVFIRISYKNII